MVQGCPCPRLPPKGRADEDRRRAERSRQTHGDRNETLRCERFQCLHSGLVLTGSDLLLRTLTDVVQCPCGGPLVGLPGILTTPGVGGVEAPRTTHEPGAH